MRGSRLAVVLTASLVCGPAQTPTSDPNSLSEVQVERLADIGRLWGAVKLFHPWLPSDQIDWDQALVQAIPRVRSAGSPEEFLVAVDFLLSFLSDPLTRVTFADEETARSETEAAPPDSRLERPTLRWPREDMALISIRDPRSFTDPGTSVQFAEVTKEAAKAEAVIFDLRFGDEAGVCELSDNEVWSYYESLESCLLSFIQGEIPMPSSRYRMYVGHPAPGASSSAFVLTQERALGGQASRPYRLVLMADERLVFPARLLFLGLQSIGAAYTIIEGEKIPEAPVTSSRMPLSDDVIAQVRVSDRVGRDGSADLQPNKIIAPSERGNQGVDQALEWAIQAAEGMVPPPVRGKAVLIPPPLALDKPYAAPEFPSEEYRLLALFRFWNTIQFFFPYKDLMDNPWDGILEEFIPKMMAAQNALDYHLYVSELVVRIQDSHGNINSQVLSRHFGTRWPPLEVKWIENKTVVTNVFSEEASQPVGISRGDVVLAVDGEDIVARRERIAKVTSASTPQSLQSRIHSRLLRGPEGREARIKVLHADGRIAVYTLDRTMGFPRGPRTTPAYGVLPEGYGYIDLERLRASEIDEAFELIRNTPAVIFDLRGYPLGTGLSIAQRLTSRKVVYAKLLWPEVHGLYFSRPVRHIFDQTLEPGDNWGYEGKVVVLINEEAISSAEHTCLMLEAAAGAKFVGSPTTGADGMVTYEALPGGIRVSFTGFEAQHGDGRQLQRVGIQPHVHVQPTIQGVRDGRDEVLERAISYLGKGR